MCLEVAHFVDHSPDYDPRSYMEPDYKSQTAWRAKIASE